MKTPANVVDASDAVGVEEIDSVSWAQTESPKVSARELPRGACRQSLLTINATGPHSTNTPRTKSNAVQGVRGASQIHEQLVGTGLAPVRLDLQTSKS
jgi:hypothetical protein